MSPFVPSVPGERKVNLSPVKGEKEEEIEEPEGVQAIPGKTSAALYWPFRWANYPENYREVLVPVFQQTCVGYIIGEEVCPTTGTPHLQDT